MENDQNGEGENHGSSKTNEHEKGESAEYVPADLRADGNNHDMPTPATKKYVLRWVYLLPILFQLENNFLVETKVWRGPK